MSRYHSQSCGCSCGNCRQSAPQEFVSRAAFDRLNRQVHELAEIVQELAKLQPGSDKPLPRARTQSIRSRSEPPALQTRVARIIGGSKTSDFPHCALIGEHLSSPGFSFTEWFCSGVLVRPRVVLTAAHCVGDRPPNVIALKAQDQNDLAKAEIIRVKKSVPHPAYRQNSSIRNHDIAVLILEKDSTVMPVELATTQELAGASMTTLVGFGLDESSVRGIKRKVDVAIQVLRKGNENLDSKEMEFGFESDDEFVAGSPSKDSCEGDSGGPAYINVPGGLRVGGLTARGIRNPSGGEPVCGKGGVYTRVDNKHLAWIKEAAGNHF